MTQRVLGPSGSERRRTRLLALTALIGAVFTVFFVAASNGTLPGSTFQSGDGDLAATLPAHDWNTPVETITCPASAPGSGTNCGLDLFKAIDPTHQDDALGQGSKEDFPVPTVVKGSIPPSKDDLTRFYVNKERRTSTNCGGTGINTCDYLYLAWERSNLLGSAHLDFELNQDDTPSANGVTPVRTAGDLLIDFDFGGSGVPVLTKHTWITSGSPALCEANNALPCWDKAVDLGAFAESQVNNTNVTDTNQPNAPFTLAGNTKNGINSTFGEAGINLTGSGIFSSTTCEHFGSAYLKSRSSGNSFTSELKDFVAPVPVDISNCGTIKIRKQTTPDGAAGTFSFTHDITSTPAVSSPFTLSDDGEQDFFNVLAGTYHVTESATTGFDFDSISCTVTGSGGSSTTSTGPALTITLKVGDVVDCTFNNNQQRGAIQVTKTRKHAAGGPGSHPQSGVSFTVNGVTDETDGNGVVCFDDLAFGDYDVTETVPDGYNADGATTKSVTVDNNATCADATYAGETVSFGNTPLTDLTVSVDSQVDGGTSSTISCKDAGDNTVASGSTDAHGDGSATASDLEPGTYTCEVVIDP